MPEAPNILVVEDESVTRAFIAATLREIGAVPTPASSLGEARLALGERSFDLLVVDRMLPDGSGLDWVAELRCSGETTAVLVLTALREVPERVKGLEAGADDYLGKPFAPLELKARVRALLRRGRPVRRHFRAGAVRLDLDRHEAFVRGQEVPVTDREFRVLERLLASRGLAREELLEDVWGEATPETSASLDVFLSRLRRKLGERGLGDAIETVRGYGFRWRGGE
jgi:two-component system, OmpR family, response regulator